MKQIKNFAAVKLLTLVAVCATLFSFSGKIGGESFEIFLNGKLMIQQFQYQKEKVVASLVLDPQAEQDEVKVTYNNCGQVDSDRMLTIRDEQNKAVKVWHFANAAAMTWKVKEISTLNKKGKLNLYYSSKELPKERLLAAVILGKEPHTALN